MKWAKNLLFIRDVPYGVTPNVMILRPQLLHVIDLHNVQWEPLVGGEMFVDYFYSHMFWKVVFAQAFYGVQGVVFCLFLHRAVLRQSFLQLRTTISMSPPLVWIQILI